MAPPSPRRSSRARPTHPQSQQSSVSSGMSGRPERNTRSLNKPSSGKSTPSASLSSEPLDELDDTLLGRRRKRGQDEDVDKTSRPDTLDTTNGSDDLQDEEDEAVRCICGSEDYPGPPPVEGPDTDIFAAIEFTEDVTGFFVQCDVCKVWQHGACVGIFSAESSPDEYFCELCRKDMHKIVTASNGSRGTSRADSLTKDGTRSPKPGAIKSSRQNSASQASKRRSTMNSRDAAYDDEQLRRAIEASREETVQDSIETGTRRTKRGRSDSEDNVTSVKRQRTSSLSATPPPDVIEPPSRDESEDETSARNGTKRARNVRGQREKSAKEDKEHHKQEAASKRKSRAERRRADADGTPSPLIVIVGIRGTNRWKDSDTSDETPLAVTKTLGQKSIEPPDTPEPPPQVEAPPDSPPDLQPTIGSSHKRPARSHHKKGKAKPPFNLDLDGDKDESPARSMSRDIQRQAEEPLTTPSNPVVPEPKQSTKTKPQLTAKMTMADMRRRVGAIMDFISRTQVDLAQEASSQSGEGSSWQNSPQKPESHANGDSENHSTADSQAATPSEASVKEFKNLSYMEMMDVLTRDMVKWQNQYT
ncbi:hypothetical protein S40288_03147 [Stachybotrys chartarum IBT 40288]|nr:hypothetical protein S40288_03147 [Stachybotrys chartarum IBT 40288]